MNRAFASPKALVSSHYAIKPRILPQFCTDPRNPIQLISWILETYWKMTNFFNSKYDCRGTSQSPETDRIKNSVFAQARRRRSLAVWKTPDGRTNERANNEHYFQDRTDVGRTLGPERMERRRESGMPKVGKASPGDSNPRSRGALSVAWNHEWIIRNEWLCKGNLHAKATFKKITINKNITDI